MEIRTTDYQIDNTGKTLVTEKLQALIDEASNKKCKLVITNGTYLTGPLFIKSNSKIHFESNVVILGTTDESQYPLLPTRVAGIEMDWYPGIINIDRQENVTISGEGTISAQGEYWWNKYWGSDHTSGMRADYDKRGLRWACDYDCTRLRCVVVSNANNITLKDFKTTDSGFWNIHILYSHNILLEGISVFSEVGGPSTDGIDIDSSYDVKVRKCKIKCDDDCIVIKSGRDSDGIRVNKPSHDIEISDCEIYEGYGITIGSELSAGVYNININNITYYNTDCGFRIKSSKTRKGYVRNVNINNLKMINVKYLFHIFLDWHKEYNTCQLPSNYQGNIPSHWLKLLAKTSDDIPLTTIENININNVQAYFEDDYQGSSRAFNIVGYDTQPITNLLLNNINATVKEFGIINYVKDIKYSNVNITVTEEYNPDNDQYDNR